MSKIYISALGNTNYSTSQYFEDNFVSEPTRYVQVATLQMWGAKEWTSANGDKIILLVTDDAKSKCYEDQLDKNNNLVKGLYSELIEMGIEPEIIIPLHIEIGKNSEEILDIFMQLNQELTGSADSELYFDLTYGLRYLPMLAVMFNNYSRFVNKTTCKKMAYGSFQTPVDGKTPIIDISWLDFIQQWTTAAENFIRSGNAEELTETTRMDRRLFGREIMTQIPRKVNDIVINLQTCQGYELIKGDIFKALRREMNKAENNLPKPLIPLMDIINNDFSAFHTEENRFNCLLGAKWCAEHKLYQQALTLLQEGTVTYLCMEFGLDWGNKDEREYINTTSHFLFQNKKNEKPSPIIQYYLNHAKGNERIHKWFQLLNSCIEPRNQYNHGGMLTKADGKKKGAKAQSMIDRIKKLTEEAYQLIKEEAHTSPKTKKSVSSPLFINLSNHPSSDWDEKQLTAAREYGEIVDMVFPAISPEAKTEDIDNLAREIAQEIIEKARTSNVTVHIMGEMTFTFVLVKILGASGIRCVAATTTRNTVDNPDGTKTSKFQFVQFREYAK